MVQFSSEPEARGRPNHPNEVISKSVEYYCITVGLRVYKNASNTMALRYESERQSSRAGKEQAWRSNTARQGKKGKDIGLQYL